MKLVNERPSILTIVEACYCIGLARATYNRWRYNKPGVLPERASHRRISDEERQRILSILCSERFCDKSVRQAWATLLDEDVYLCSIRTMYRILSDNKAVRERRNQLTHPEYKKPELMATGPNQLWSWDITKLHGPSKWTYFYLYVILDVYSRKVVGWMVAHRESATLATKLIQDTCEKEGIAEDQLTIHADRGTSMRSKAVAFLLADLGVTKTHSRPYTSSDNPYSEAHFKTLKYHPSFPKQFGCIQDARVFLRKFFKWYNCEHRHSGIGLVTPDQRHTGEDKVVTVKRKETLERFYERHPERFVKGLPHPPEIPGAVWINKPNKKEVAA